MSLTLSCNVENCLSIYASVCSQDNANIRECYQNIQNHFEIKNILLGVTTRHILLKVAVSLQRHTKEFEYMEV